MDSYEKVTINKFIHELPENCDSLGPNAILTKSNTLGLRLYGDAPEIIHKEADDENISSTDYNNDIDKPNTVIIYNEPSQPQMISNSVVPQLRFDNGRKSCITVLNRTDSLMGRRRSDNSQCKKSPNADNRKHKQLVDHVIRSNTLIMSQIQEDTKQLIGPTQPTLDNTKNRDFYKKRASCMVLGPRQNLEDDRMTAADDKLNPEEVQRQLSTDQSFFRKAMVQHEIKNVRRCMNNYRRKDNEYADMKKKAKESFQASKSHVVIESRLASSKSTYAFIVWFFLKEK